MVSSSRLLLGALLLAAVAGGSGTNYGQAPYDRVFSFGDSLTDTGNSAILPATAGGPFTNAPYGMTHFNRPNGRASDGSLVLDFIEQCKLMASSLFYFGEIGFNEYSFALSNVSNNDSVGLAESLVPHIVGVIRSALIDVIAAGAKTVVVAGMIPMGWEPELLALVPGVAGDYYDGASGCITRFNQVSQMHNRELNSMLCELRRDHPRTSIHYGDLYHPITKIVSSPGKYGFGGMPLAACCGGGGGPYNFNFTFFRGTPLSSACADPSDSVSWDGIHYTEAANKFVANAMLSGL